MKTFYPNKNFRVVGEINNKTGIQCSTVDNLDGKPLPVYKEKTHNKLTESVAGYTAVDDHTYLAVVKNVLMKKLLLFLSALQSLHSCLPIFLYFNILRTSTKAGTAGKQFYGCSNYPKCREIMNVE
jgi:ssDNA-binding Zn-finger/Zn-ribbon topoisomerase 1